MHNPFGYKFVIGAPVTLKDIPVTLTDGQVMHMNLSIEDSSAGGPVIMARRRNGRQTWIPHCSLFWTELPPPYERSSQQQLWRFLRRRFAKDITRAMRVFHDLALADQDRLDSEANLARARTKAVAARGVDDGFDKTTNLPDQLDAFKPTANECHSFTADCLSFGGESGRYVLYTLEGPIILERVVKEMYVTLTLDSVPAKHQQHGLVGTSIRINRAGPEVASTTSPSRKLFNFLNECLPSNNDYRLVA